MTQKVIVCALDNWKQAQTHDTSGHIRKALQSSAEWQVYQPCLSTMKMSLCDHIWLAQSQHMDKLKLHISELMNKFLCKSLTLLIFFLLPFLT